MKSVFVYKSAQSPNTSRSVSPSKQYNAFSKHKVKELKGVHFDGFVTPSTDNFVCDEVNAIYLILMTR